VATGVAMAFSTPHKLRPKVCTKSILDNFDEAVLRTVHNFYLTEKQQLTLKAIHSKMCESTGYVGGVSSLRLVLRKMGCSKFNSPNRRVMNTGTLPKFHVHSELYMLPLNIHASIWNILYCRWKKTSDNRKFIVERHDIRSLRVKYLRLIKAYRKEGRQLCTQMKLIYSANIQHPKRGMTSNYRPCW
jgi:hypothetical protein